MKLLSLFDGSGGFPLAASQCGITPIMASEVEPYPIAVTTSRFPQMRHLGDISKINGAEIEPVDVITFGSPCQDLSVAGKQAGLKHEDNGDSETTRSGLFMEAVRIIKEMRRATHGKYPKFAVWENVPGAFSSNKGEDFRTVLEEIVKISEPTAPPLPMPEKGKWPYADVIMGDGFSIAYRTFDAQHWGRTILDRDSGTVLQMGTPQRRRRIYLVADLTGQCAGEVLLEPARLLRNSPSCGTEGQRAAATAQGSAGATDRESIITVATQQGGAEITEDGICPTVTAAAGMSGNNQPWICKQTAYGISSYDSNSMKSSNPHSGIYEADTSRTLDLNGGNPACNQGGIAIVEPTFILDNIGGQSEYGKESEVNGTLRSGAQGAIAYAVENHPADSRVNIDESGTCQTLTSRMGTGGGNVPMVMEAFCKSGRGKFKGDAETWKDGIVANTLNTFDQGESRANELIVEEIPAITSSKASFFMRTEEELASTLVATDYKDPQMVCYCLQGNGIDRADTAGCNGKGWRENESYTLNTIDRPAVAYGLDRASFNQGKNALYNFSVLPEQQPTLTAKGPGAVCTRYIVRRLTPIECARLQGFPDTWGYP